MTSTADKARQIIRQSSGTHLYPCHRGGTCRKPVASSRLPAGPFPYRTFADQTSHFLRRKSSAQLLLRASIVNASFAAIRWQSKYEAPTSFEYLRMTFETRPHMFTLHGVKQSHPVTNVGSTTSRSLVSSRAQSNPVPYPTRYTCRSHLKHRQDLQCHCFVSSPHACHS